jgi:hypothetical protein
MIIFHSRQSDCARRVHKNENVATFNFTSQIASSICTVTFTKCIKPDATIFKLQCNRMIVNCRFMTGHALLLNFVRLLRLANSSPMIQRSPARRSRNVREPSGKKSGEMSRGISTQFPGNCRASATAMPPTVRQDDSQDNLPCAGLGRAMSAPETGETTRNLSAQRPRQHLASGSWKFRRQLLTMTSKNYEHTNHTNARS